MIPKEKKIKDIEVIAGKWVKVNNVGYMTCCDCGLVHRIKFKVSTKDGKPEELWLRFWRNEKLTKKERRKLTDKLKPPQASESCEG